VRYQSLEGKQPLFYAANAVGLKYALQALDEHLLRKPSSSSSADGKPRLRLRAFACV